MGNGQRKAGRTGEAMIVTSPVQPRARRSPSGVWVRSVCRKSILTVYNLPFLFGYILESRGIKSLIKTIDIFFSNKRINSC